MSESEVKILAELISLINDMGNDAAMRDKLHSWIDNTSGHKLSIIFSFVKALLKI